MPSRVKGAPPVPRYCWKASARCCCATASGGGISRAPMNKPRTRRTPSGVAPTGAKCRLNVRLHRHQLSIPIAPTVYAVAIDIECRIVAAGRGVGVPESYVALQDDLLD